MKGKKIITYASDLETIIAATLAYSKISKVGMPKSEAIRIYDTFHRVEEPILRNYQEVPSIKKILDEKEKGISKHNLVEARLYVDHTEVLSVYFRENKKINLKLEAKIKDFWIKI